MELEEHEQLGNQETSGPQAPAGSTEKGGGLEYIPVSEYCQVVSGPKVVIELQQDVEWMPTLQDLSGEGLKAEMKGREEEVL